MIGLIDVSTFPGKFRRPPALDALRRHTAGGRRSVIEAPRPPVEARGGAAAEPRSVREREEGSVTTLAFIFGLAIAVVGAVGMVLPSALVWIAQQFLLLRRVRLATLAAFSVLICVACDSSSLSNNPPGVCTESGAQCQLPEGPLGVCERSPCPGGAVSPCFQCTPQH